MNETITKSSESYTLSELTGEDSRKGVNPSKDEKEYLLRRFSDWNGIIPIKKIKEALRDYRDE